MNMLNSKFGSIKEASEQMPAFDMEWALRVVAKQHRASANASAQKCKMESELAEIAEKAADMEAQRKAKEKKGKPTIVNGGETNTGELAN